MKSKMTKQVGVNNGMPCTDKPCGKCVYYTGNGYCTNCGWHYSYHIGFTKPESYDSSASDVAEIAADVGGSLIGAAMDIFGGGNSGGSSDDYSSSDSGSSNDDDSSGGGGDFGGGGSDSGW